jgi:hypothetical protein
MGGSYLSAMGDETRLTPGTLTFTNALTNIERIEFFNEFAESTLSEVRRAGAHVAIGSYLGPATNYGLFSLRVGLRLAHVRGQFSSELTDEVQMAIDDPMPQETVTAINNGFSRTDTSCGVFIGMESVLYQRRTPIGHIQFVLDGEFANDWIEFDNFGDDSLATGSVLFGFTIGR